MRRFLFLLLLVVTPPALGAEVSAVASFSIIGDLVKQVGGDRVAVTTIVGPNADTHIYEPKPGDAAAVAGADIFFVNGLGFEGWMERLVESTGLNGTVAVLSEGVVTREIGDAGEQAETDPHAWQSLSNAALYVRNIAKGLCVVDPGMCDFYSGNAEAYVAKLMALDAELRAAIARIPEDRRKVITTHDAFGYFGGAYGVQFLAPEGISTDAEPSAMDVARLIVQIKSEGVSALFIENMSDGRLLEQIAAETGVRMGGELYADALSEPDGPAPTFLDMFRHNIDLLVPAMEGK